MGSQRLTAIADSGPIIHLAEISCLSILSIFEELHVPDAVWAETVKRLKLLPVGSLGIIAKAYKLGKISMSDAQSHIIALYEESSLFVTREIVEMAIEQL